MRPPKPSIPAIHRPTPAAIPTHQLRRRIRRDSARANELRDHAFRRVILSIPPGKVSTYGEVAAAAGYPLYHRAVARLLRTDPPDSLPWHRVVGAGGRIKLRDAAALEQHARLLLEGIQFLAPGSPKQLKPEQVRIDMARFSQTLRTWEPPI